MGDIVSEEQYFEMLWDCPQCGTKGLLGKSQRHCPACGMAQDPSKRYFPEPGQEVEATGHQYVGVDWTCAYCDTPNAALAAFCANCGGPKDGAKTVALVSDGPAAPPPAAPQAMPPRPGFPWVKLAAAVMLLLVAGLGFLFFSKHDETATVSALRWSRTIDVERFVAASDSAWCDSLPAGAYSVTHTREQRGTRKIEDGQECTDKRVDMGDGTFRKQRDCHTRYREEPVYDDRCHFHINRWQLARTEKAAGDASAPPLWPSPRLSQPAFSLDGLGRERLGGRHERYTAELQSSKGKTWSCDLPATSWANLKQGESVTVKVRGTGGAVCDTLHPL